MSYFGWWAVSPVDISACWAVYQVSYRNIANMAGVQLGNGQWSMAVTEEGIGQTMVVVVVEKQYFFSSSTSNHLSPQTLTY